MAQLTKIEELDHNRTGYTIEVSAEEFKAEIIAVYHKTAKNYPVPNGVRKGHAAPRKIIENYYGEYVFYNDAIDKFINDFIPNAIKDKDYYGEPEYKYNKMSETEGLEIQVIFDANVKVELGEYKGIKLKKTDYTVHKKDVEEAVEAKLDKECKEHAVEKTVEDRPVKNGDIVTIDYSGSVDGVKFEGGTAENQKLEIGSGSFIPGFEEQLIGMNINDDKDITVKFPDDYHAENLAGKDSVFAIKLHAITERQLPNIDDEFISDISDYDTLEEYKKQTAKEIEKEMRANMEHKKKDDALLALIANAKECVVPYAIVKQSAENEILSYYNRMGLNIKSFDEFCNMVGQTPEQVIAPSIETTERRIKIELLSDKIAEAEKIEITDAEAEEYIRKEADNAFAANKETDNEAELLESKEKSIKETLENKEITTYLKYNMRIEKAQQIVFDSMEIK